MQAWAGEQLVLKMFLFFKASPFFVQTERRRICFLLFQKEWSEIQVLQKRDGMLFYLTIHSHFQL